MEMAKVMEDHGVVANLKEFPEINWRARFILMGSICPFSNDVFGSMFQKTASRSRIARDAPLRQKIRESPVCNNESPGL
ncbi:hypothetical protein AMTR_s00105p00100250 [Amborella trichopoda]|uniref:Uncharacterized protein n=1 Tax=Amborella trichopoda TaxID=13333 RepID=W1NWP2_AMBTC|nr:hypothetical protein AMTR_s00105p00100250 [Amborella trichopoda]